MSTTCPPEEVRWLSPEEDVAWRSYRQMKGLLDLAISRDLAADSGLSDADYDVLSNLSELEERRGRVRDLAARMLWSPSRLSHHLARMQDRGLVARIEADGDARGMEVTLTDEGWEVLVAAAPSHVASVRRHFMDVMTPEQITVLAELAVAVLAGLEDS